MRRSRQTRARIRKVDEKFPAKPERFLLRLFVTGSTRRSMEAVVRVKRVCEENLKGRYKLEVCDVYQDPTQAEDDQIIALPTLVKKLPLPLRKIIGSFSDDDRLLAVLGVTPVRRPR